MRTTRALAGAVPLVQGGDRAVGAVHAGEQVADRHADLASGRPAPVPVSDIRPASPWAIWS